MDKYESSNDGQGPEFNSLWNDAMQDAPKFQKERPTKMHIEFLKQDEQSLVIDIRKRIDDAIENNTEAPDSVWTDIQNLKDNSGPIVHDVYVARQLRNEMIDDKNELIYKKAQLKRLPSLTSPWSEDGRAKSDIRKEISQLKRHVEENRDKVEKIDNSTLKQPPSLHDLELIRTIDRLERLSKPLAIRRDHAENRRRKKRLEELKGQSDQTAETQNEIKRLSKQIKKTELAIIKYQQENPHFKLEPNTKGEDAA